MAAAVVVMPVAPAHASAGPEFPVALEVRFSGVKLAGVYGTVQFGDSNTTLKYSLAVCRESSYTPPSVWVSLNGGPNLSIDGGSPVTIPQCRYTAYLTNGEIGTTPAVLATARLTLEGVHFDPQNQATRRSASTTYTNPAAA